MKPSACLTSPVRLGAYTLPNRIVIASKPQLLTDNNLPQPQALDYYARKASCGLIITEPTLVTADDALPKLSWNLHSSTSEIVESYYRNCKKKKG